jgi:gamma-glutamylcysteine synthetase
LSVWDFDSNETYYDQEKNQWILKKSVGDVPPVCTKLLNENKTMPAIVRGMGDAGCSSASWYLITNKNYAIALRVSQCGYDLDLNALAEQIKGTFVVLPEVQIIAPTCK